MGCELNKLTEAPEGIWQRPEASFLQVEPTPLTRTHFFLKMLPVLDPVTWGACGGWGDSV